MRNWTRGTDVAVALRGALLDTAFAVETTKREIRVINRASGEELNCERDGTWGVERGGSRFGLSFEPTDREVRHGIDLFTPFVLAATKLGATIRTVDDIKLNDAHGITWLGLESMRHAASGRVARTFGVMDLEPGVRWPDKAIVWPATDVAGPEYQQLVQPLTDSVESCQAQAWVSARLADANLPERASSPRYIVVGPDQNWPLGAIAVVTTGRATADVGVVLKCSDEADYDLRAFDAMIVDRRPRP